MEYIYTIYKYLKKFMVYRNSLKSSFWIVNFVMMRTIMELGNGTTTDVTKNQVENQGNKEEKEAGRRIKIFDFE